MKQTPLKIHLLGPVEIKFEDELLKISRRIERTILYILAIEHKPVSRTKLIDLLWPDGGQSDARASLRTALSRLRNELPDSTLIKTELDQVWLDLDRCRIDLLEFENQYQQLRNILSAYQKIRSLPAAIADQIHNALDLWQGDNIISGDDLSNYPEVDSWQKSNNRKFNHQRKVLISRLAQHYKNLGQLEKALNLFIQLSKLDNTDVTSQCAAMDIFINTGRLQDAINYCDTLENIYEHEFNAPLPDEILSRCQQAQFRKYYNQNDEEDQWPIPLQMQLEMIGRQSELSQLIKAFYGGGMVSIKGEMGSGKTRLVQELFHTLSPKPFLFLAPSREMENSLPFSPIIYCLRQGITPNIWNEIDQIWINQLSLLLPELTSFLKGEKQPPFPRLPKGTQQIFDAFLNVCQHVAKKNGRILFFLDDAHWADVETLQALSYLMSNRFFEKYGLLVIASRSEERNPNLDLMIDQSFRSHTVEIIQLKGLSQYELKNLVKQVLDDPPSTTFIDKLYQETSGNPFLALEIIRNILETQDYLGDPDQTSSLPLPTNVHMLIRKRLNQLDKTSYHILRCAAVLGNNISMDLLQSVAEIPPVSFSKLLHPLLESGFIYTDQKSHHNGNFIHFSHEKMREVILKEASVVQLQILHRQVAQLMAKDSDYSDKAAIIANHFLMGEDKRNAFDWFFRAADHAWILGAKEETHQAYQQAEKLLSNSPKGYFIHDDTLALYQHWGEFAYQSNQTNLLENLGVKLQYLGNRAKSPTLIGASKILLANACFLRLEYDTGLELINSAIENFMIINDQVWLIKAIKRKGVLNWWLMNYAEAESSAKKMLALTRNADLDEDFRITMEFNAKYLINYLHYSHGDAKLAARYAEELHKEYFYKLKPIDRLKSLYLLGYVNLISGQYEASEYYSRQGLEIANLLDNAITGENILICLSKAEFIRGNLNQSYQYALKALKSAEKGKRKINIVGANCVIGDIFFSIKNYTAAVQHYRVGQIREGFSIISLHGLENSMHLAQLLVWTDQLLEAKEILDKNLDICQKLDLAQLYVYGLMILGIYHFHERRFSLAKDQFNKAIRIAEEKGLLLELALNKISLAKLNVSTGKMDKAQMLLNETLDISESRNMAWPTLYGLELSMHLDKVQNRPEMLHKHQDIYESLHKKIIDNIQSEALRQDIDLEKRSWDQEHHFPS